MRSYRFARRSFLAGIGGAVGLKVLLQNLEASAQGVTSPPRFLMTHWPVGTIRYHFVPTGTGSNYTFSRILKPFEAAGLKDDMTILYGLNQEGVISAGMGGGHESGTPMTTTGANCPGTRDNNGEDDDGCAGGPSWDQILLKNVPDLQRPGTGYANAICDARVDSLETSTQCLSYDYATRSIQSARPGGMITENIPLLPTLSPVQLYMNLFSGFMPGGDTPGNQEELLRALRARKSVLDFALGQLSTLETLAPGSEKAKIDFHAEAIRKIEMQLQSQIDMGGTVSGCMLPTAPDPDLVGKTGSKFDYDSPGTSTADDDVHAQIGDLHSSLLLAAFQCDLIRVATFQWSPGTNHVSFAGMFPDEPNAIYMHHPLTHRINNRSHVMDAPPGDTELASVVEFMANVQTWYNEKTAAIINKFKNATDANGNSLLDYTVIPYVTEVAETTHSRYDMPAMIFGGKALGMQHGTFQSLNDRSYNAFWTTIAQAYLKTNDPLATLGDEVFVKNGASPISGLWSPV